MNILTLAVGFPESLREATISGEVKNAYSLVKLLERKGHEVYVVSAPTIWQSNKKRILNPRLRITQKGIGSGIFRYLLRAILMTPDIYSLLRNNRIDVFHCHSPVQLLPIWFALLVFRPCRNIPIFVTAHGTYLPEFYADVREAKGFRNFLKKINSWLQYRLDRFLYKRFNKVIVTSSYQIKEMQDIYKIPQKKLCIINNPAAIYFDKQYRNSAQVTSRKIKYKPGLIKLLFVGRFVKKKGLFNLIKAVNILVEEDINVHLTCVGGGMIDLDMMSEINQFIQKNNLNKYISFKLEVSEITLARFYKDCDCLVVPSIGYESIPTVVIEGIKSGIKVFATGKWGVPEVLLDESLFLKENDIDDIVSKIKQYSTNRVLNRPTPISRLFGNEIVNSHEKIYLDHTT